MNNLKADVNAVRGVLINEGKVLCIKNKVDRVNYFDLPGGQIEPGESKEEACIREFMEETGVKIDSPEYKGDLVILNANKHIIHLNMFLVEKFDGIPKDFEENSSMWMDIKEYLSQELLYANSIILDDFFYKIFTGEKKFEIKLEVDNLDKITKLDFRYM